MATSLSRATFVNLNPATGETLGEHPITSPETVHAAVHRAHQAQRMWTAEPVGHRRQVISRFQHLLTERRRDVAATITEESGKPRVEALLTEVMVVLDAARFCIENVTRVLGEVDVPHGNPIMKTKRGRLLHEPLGVIGIISPWNYPFSTPATESIAALITGNAVVLKPSELTPNSAMLLRDLLHEAGVPKNVFEVVTGEGPTGAALISSGIDKIIFTGSVATGKRVAAVAAEQLIPALLELGGKDPMIVLEDADIDIASSAAVWGSLMNAGQTCISIERCYVHNKIFEAFVAQCEAKIRKLKIGNGADSATEIGPMISLRQLEIVESQVEEARQGGAVIVCGGKRLPELGPNFYAPTLVTNVDRKMRLMREETFGPVLPVMAFSSDAEAIALANDSEFGLAASVWGKSAHAERIAQQIEAGAILVNDVITQFAISEAPHGGLKSSGIGRTHGLLGMQAMLRTRYLAVEHMSRMKRLWWYGYGEKFSRQMDGFVELLFGRGVASRMASAINSMGAILRKRR